MNGFGKIFIGVGKGIIDLGILGARGWKTGKFRPYWEGMRWTWKRRGHETTMCVVLEEDGVLVDQHGPGL